MVFESPCLPGEKGKALGTEFNYLANDIVSHASIMAPNEKSEAGYGSPCL